MVANLSIQKEDVTIFVPLVDIVVMHNITKRMELTALCVNKVNPY